MRINRRRIKLGEYVFQRHGGTVVLVGRFISILRTYAAFLADTNRMPWKRFALFYAAGGISGAASTRSPPTSWAARSST